MEKKFDLKINGNAAEVCMDELSFTVTTNGNIDGKITVAVDDIVAIDTDHQISANQNEQAENTSSHYFCLVHYIKKHEKYIWTKEILTIKPNENGIDDLNTFCSELNNKFDKISSVRPKRLLVLLNPIGGTRQGQTVYDTVMTPIFELANISCKLIVSQRPKHLIEVMKTRDCTDVDGIVIVGGDGTVTEVINVLIKKTQEEASIDYNDPKSKLKPLSKPVCIVPTGTGNGAAETLTGCIDVLTSTLHIVRGKTKSMQLLASYCDNKLIGYSACVFGTLYNAELMERLDAQLRWMRTLRYLMIPFIFFFKSLHIAPVQITMYSKEKQVSDEGREKIVEKEETFTQDCCMAFLFPWAMFDDEGKMHTTVNRIGKDEFSGLIYKPMGKLALTQHMLALMWRKENACAYPEIQKVKCSAMRWKVLGTEDKPAESDRRNIMVNIDGEVLVNTKAEYYIQLVNYVVNAYSSL